jgi:DNA-binding response OmpR family regulator
MAGALSGKRILIVEDEYFIASDMQQALVREGAIVAGPVPTLSGGLALVASERIDCAILDVNLEGDVSFPLARQLQEMGVPYLLLTGYDGWSLPAEYRGVPRIAKPFAVSGVVSMLERLVTTEEAL